MVYSVKTFNNINQIGLKELGNKYKISQWVEASRIFESSGEVFKEICFAASDRDREKISELLLKAAELEEKAYQKILSLY